MAILLPSFYTNGHVARDHLTLYEPSDYTWIVACSEEDLACFRAMKQDRIALPPHEIIAEVNKANEETLSLFRDMLENYYLREQPQWWAQGTDEQLDDAMTSLVAHFPMYRVDYTKTMCNPESVWGVSHLDLYPAMALPEWRYHFLDNQIPWDHWILPL